MLTHARATAPLAVAVSMLVVWLAAPAAAGPFDPDDPCTADPTTAQCQETEPAQPPGDESDGGGRWCGRHNGVRVPCNAERLGFWVGTPEVIYGYYTAGLDASLTLVGCWARRPQFPGPRPQPQDTVFPIRGEDTGGPGRWFVLSCLGPDGTWPGGVVEGVAAVWLFTADLDIGPDPEGIARRALAQIGLSAAQVTLHPPVSGSVPLGMPVWLSVNETAAAWGPITDEHCEDGLCVAIEAWAVRLDWQMGDGATVSCSRGQNRTWKPGMDFLTPGQACHHLYTEPSRGEQGGRYQVTASTIFHADWSGGGQSGTFTEVTDACGPDGAGPCQASTTVRVDEIQVLVEQ